MPIICPFTRNSRPTSDECDQRLPSFAAASVFLSKIVHLIRVMGNEKKDKKRNNQNPKKNRPPSLSGHCV
jgi:hypothetical protein